jgi:putative hydrolase of the HAD superfamily
MPALGLPTVLLFDLDDTIVRFSCGQPDFWRLAFERHLPQGVDSARLSASIERVSQIFWGAPERAFWGRQNMQLARRKVALEALLSHGIDERSCLAIADEMTELKEAHVRPFEGAVETLDALRARGHRLGLLTNGSSAFQRRKLQRFALESRFELIAVEGELGFGKPDARVFHRALEHFGCAGHEALMVGDNLHADLEGAAAVGIAGVWHDAYESGLPAESPVEPAWIVTRITELLDLKSLAPRLDRRDLDIDRGAPSRTPSRPSGGVI